MSVLVPPWQQPVPQGSTIQRRVAEQQPVTVPYFDALTLRGTLKLAASLIRLSAAELPCEDGTDRCLHCATQSVADSLLDGEKLLRGEG